MKRPVLALLLLAVAPLFAGTTLTGTQKEATLELPKGTHVLKGLYTVPEGKRLKLAAGAQIQAEKGASLVVEGDFETAGDAAAPVVMRGQKWAGIQVAKSGTATLAGLQITGAEEGVTLRAKTAAVTGCVFHKNKKGLICSGKGTHTLTDSLFSENDEFGLQFSGPSGSVKNCSFVKNKNLGIDLGDTTPEIDACAFADNGGSAIFQSNAGGATGLRGARCSFVGKGVALEVPISHGSVVFSECYWGDKSTALLKSKGVDANLPNVLDARDSKGSLKVQQPGFLTAPPKNCGATVKCRL